MINKINNIFRTNIMGRVVGFSLMLGSGGLLTNAQEVQTDTNTPLHLIQPDYPYAYGHANRKAIEQQLDKVRNYLESVTPAVLIDKTSGRKVRVEGIKANVEFAKGQFRLTSYEWGVTYAGMLTSYGQTKDKAYQDYVVERLSLLRDLYSFYEARPVETWAQSPIPTMLQPHALDDAGALCMAMIKYSLEYGDSSFRPLIDHFMTFIMEKEHRLQDGTFARNRPQKNTLWLDDLFMSVPAIAYMGKLTGDMAYYDEACKQVLQFADRMFDRQKNIFSHGWLSEAEVQPHYHWGRANGWALMAMTELLRVLPKNHKDYSKILGFYRSHVSGLAALQSGKGFWHQLLDRNDSYLETSATAIFTYCIAQGINEGWIDDKAFGPLVLLAWEAVSSQVTSEGQITGTCVGTGMGFDPGFYYYRPINVFAAHAYGPFLLAGAEIIRFLERHGYRLDETAVQFNVVP